MLPKRPAAHEAQDTCPPADHVPTAHAPQAPDENACPAGQSGWIVTVVEPLFAWFASDVELPYAHTICFGEPIAITCGPQRAESTDEPAPPPRRPARARLVYAVPRTPSALLDVLHFRLNTSVATDPTTDAVQPPSSPVGDAIGPLGVA